jgi:hypothetical protein
MTIRTTEANTLRASAAGQVTETMANRGLRALEGTSGTGQEETFIPSRSQDTPYLAGKFALQQQHAVVTQTDVAAQTPAAGASPLCAEITAAPLRFEEKDLRVNMKYPQVQGGIGDEQQRVINGQLNAWARTKAADLRAQGQQNMQLFERPSSAWGDYVVMGNNDRFTSFIERASFYMEGAAHPENSQETFNFNTNTGSSISFDDLFALPATEATDLFRDYEKVKRRETRRWWQGFPGAWQGG